MLCSNNVYFTKVCGQVKFVFNLHKCYFQRKIYRRKKSIMGNILLVTRHLGRTGE